MYSTVIVKLNNNDKTLLTSLKEANILNILNQALVQTSKPENPKGDHIHPVSLTSSIETTTQAFL